MAEKAQPTKPSKRPAKKPAAAPSTAPGTESRVEEEGPELQDRIQQRAYQIWESEGRPGGRDAEHWRRAEREIRQGMAGAPSRGASKDDTSGAVAPPKKAGRPGASAELGGTPSATATSSGGRQTPSSRRKTVTRT